MTYTRTCDGCGGNVAPGSIRYVLSEYEKSVPVYRQDFCSYPCVIAPKPTGGRSRHAPPLQSVQELP